MSGPNGLPPSSPTPGPPAGDPYAALVGVLQASEFLLRGACAAAAPPGESLVPVIIVAGTSSSVHTATMLPPADLVRVLAGALERARAQLAKSVTLADPSVLRRLRPPGNGKGGVP